MSYDKVRYVEANYNTTLRWDLQDIAESKGFNLDDIKHIEVGKWGSLYITLKNDKVYVEDYVYSYGEETDWKWSEEDFFFDENYDMVEVA